MSHIFQALKGKADIVVAKDGTGNFTTVTEAVAAAPENSKERYIIYVKKGVYDEIVNIGKRKVNITIVGDGRDSTLLTGSLSGIKTFLTATLGNNFLSPFIEHIVLYIHICLTKCLVMQLQALTEMDLWPRI